MLDCAPPPEACGLRQARQRGRGRNENQAQTLDMLLPTTRSLRWGSHNCGEIGLASPSIGKVEGQGGGGGEKAQSLGEGHSPSATARRRVRGQRESSSHRAGVGHEDGLLSPLGVGDSVYTAWNTQGRIWGALSRGSLLVPKSLLPQRTWEKGELLGEASVAL